eukprot:Gb_14250 [translate_table: standard]
MSIFRTDGTEFNLQRMLNDFKFAQDRFPSSHRFQKASNPLCVSSPTMRLMAQRWREWNKASDGCLTFSNLGAQISEVHLVLPSPSRTFPVNLSSSAHKLGAKDPYYFYVWWTFSSTLPMFSPGLERWQATEPYTFSPGLGASFVPQACLTLATTPPFGSPRFWLFLLR